MTVATVAPPLSAEVTTIAAREAASLLALWSYSGQRPVSRLGVTSLAGAITRGELTFIVLHTGTMGDDSYLVDGQHRLSALAYLAEAGQGDVSLPAVIVDHRCYLAADIATLYAQFDRGRKRGFTDVYRAMGLPEQLGLHPREIRTISYAAAVMMADFSTSHPVADGRLASAQARARFLDEWALEAREYYGIIRGTTKEVKDYLERAAVTSVALITMRYQEATARKFWTMMAADEGGKGDPSRTLLTFLRGHRAASKPRHVYARYVASAWNAYFAGDRINKLSLKSPELPILILGTPYARRTTR